MTQQKRQPSRGFTILEVVVVMAILTLLIALIVPALQRSREASRSLTCRNHLKQLGVAAHSFHEAHQEFASHGGMMWELLPYVEQQALYDKLEPYIVGNKKYPISEDISPNVSVYVCPSSSAAPSQFEFSYFVNGGTFWTGRLQDKRGDSLRNGMSAIDWYGGTGVRVRNVYDGTSNTAFFSEIKQPLAGRPPANPSPRNSAPFYWQIDQLPMTSLEFGRLSANPSQPAPPPNLFLIEAKFDRIVYGLYKHVAAPNQPACRVLEDDSWVQFQDAESIPPSSHHDGGVNVLMVDGSVRFVADEIDLVAWQDLGSRDSRMKEPPPMTLSP